MRYVFEIENNIYLCKFLLHFSIVDKTSRPMIGGCYWKRYGCCDDGLTAALGEYKYGCPEQDVVTMKVEEVTTPQPTTTSTTTASTSTPTSTSTTTVSEKLELSSHRNGDVNYSVYCRTGHFCVWLIFVFSRIFGQSQKLNA